MTDHEEDRHGAVWHAHGMRLLLLFVVLPAVELALLIELGNRFGTLHTLALIVITGVVGASLARGQGLAVVRKIQNEVAEGRLPAHSLVDGVIILLAAALLVTPGVLTDAFGFLVKRVLWRRLERAVAENRDLHVDVNGFEAGESRTVRDLRDTGEPVPRSRKGG